MPLGIPTLALKRSTSYFEEPHRHPRTDLRKFHSLISCSYKDVMPHFYAVFNILECDYPATNFVIRVGRFSRRE